jgi:hypothetical protein
LSEGSASFIVVVMTDSLSAEVLSRSCVLGVVDSGRPDESLSVDELGSRIVGLAGRLAAATCRWLLLVAQFDPERGAIVQSAIEAIADAGGIDQAAALVRMAEIALAAVADTAQPVRGLRGDERAAVIIHLSAADLPVADGASRPASGEAAFR